MTWKTPFRQERCSDDELPRSAARLREKKSISNPAELENQKVAGAVRTDFILSAEIMALTLAGSLDWASIRKPRFWRPSGF